MFELTNEQRLCFGLEPVSADWVRIEAKKGPYGQYRTYLYLDGDRVKKCIMCGDDLYSEYELSETVSPDRGTILPKTPKGKPATLTAASVEKCKGTGMRLYYSDGNIHLFNEITQCSYYTNSYLERDISDISGFSKWVDDWCRETTQADLEDIRCFGRMDRKRIRYREGDVFRFKIGRREYGYGRVLLNYDAMRRRGEPFWDILMGKPLVCSVYHIITVRDDVSIEELKELKSLPSAISADNALFYGEYQIIGNVPVTEQEDHPVMYGDSILLGEKAVNYQCGKVYRKLEGRSAIYAGFRNNGVAFDLNLTRDVLIKCIEADSNDPYWKSYYAHFTERDLRNPIHADKLQKVRRQVGL